MVPGKLLLELVSRSRATTVELRSAGEHAVLKLGDLSMKLTPTLPAECFQEWFSMPKVPKQHHLRGVMGQFLAGVEFCLPSLCSNAYQPDQWGITLIPNGSTLRLYATDAETISRAILPLPGSGKTLKRVILSGEFCRAMLRLAKQAQTVRFVLREDHALFLADDSLLFGRLIDTRAPLNFDRAVQRHLPERYTEAMVDIPKPKLELVIKRATRITEIKGNVPPTDIEIEGGTAAFHSCSKRGEVNDTMLLPGHRNVAVRVNTSLLAGCQNFDRILFTERCVIMTKGTDMLRLVATYVRKQRRGPINV